jgi:hypothetical protein
MNNIKLKLVNSDVNKSVKDYLVSCKVPYTEEHLKMSKEIFWSKSAKPEWFDLHDLGLDYDDHYLMELHELKGITYRGDLQPQRFTQNPKRAAIKKDVVDNGKDIRCKPVFVVKDENGIDSYIQDGNTFSDIGKELNFPNFLVIRFNQNFNWSQENAVSIGVRLNLLEKHFGGAVDDDVENALKEISKSKEFKKLLKNPDENFSIASNKLLSYYTKMIGKKEVNVTINRIIEKIVFGNSNKFQKLAVTSEDVMKAAVLQGFTDNSSVIYSAYAGFGKHLHTEKLRTLRKMCASKATKIGTIIIKNGASHGHEYWWIKETYKEIERIESFAKFLAGSEEVEKHFIAGVYQNHMGTDVKFPVGTIVSVEEVKLWYRELKDSDII